MRVLVAEDGMKMARAIRRELEQEGYAVDVCTDGDETFRRGMDNDYDAIVLDVMLPAATASRSAGNSARGEGGRRS